MATDIGHAVAVSLLDGDRLICVDTVAGRHSSVELTRAGDELPLFATSEGTRLAGVAVEAEARV